jgi:mannose-6-phosphate isomerase-like protein (cupin superfamily)
MGNDRQLSQDGSKGGVVHPAGDVTRRDFADWTPELRDEFRSSTRNYRVGSKLLSETETLKIWEIRLKPGERLPAHKHVLDYFWTVMTDGDSLQHTDDGTTRLVSYEAGTTRHTSFGPGQYLMHDLNNTGTTDLIFITVEHKRQPGDAGPRQV